MSNYNLYGVFDSCSAIFGDPLVAANDAAAKRLFDFTLSDPGVPDYVRKDAVLYALGHFDNTTGTVVQDILPYVVARGCNVQPLPRDEVTSNEE